MNSYSLLTERINQMLTERGQPPRSLTPSTRLAEVGFDSLDLAALIVHLEEETGKDPFSSGTITEFPPDLQALASLYD
jgi:hypothetical protein